MSDSRPNWDEYFMQIAEATAKRSNCCRRQVGAVIVRDNRIVSTGYNGTPRGIKNCNEGGCKRCNSSVESGAQLNECICCHAEENAIVQAAYHGVSVKGSKIYTVFSPCLYCTKMIINAGILEVIYKEEYRHDSLTVDLFKEANIEIRKS